MRVLIADDDEKFREFARSTLTQRTDHEVQVVADGLLALQTTLKEQPDVLVLDWMMPSMNGTQVCRLVRAQSHNPDIYIMIVTSRGRREELIECLHAGADDLLLKPVPPDLLVARLDVVARRMAGPQQLTERVRRALLSAAAQRDGELVVLGGTQSARVFFHDGKVAWIDLPDGSGSFLQVLAKASGFDRETVGGVVDECRKSGRRLTDTIVGWGLMEREQLQQELRSWMSDKLHAIALLPGARTMFLPSRRDFADSMLFSLQELGIEEEQASAMAPEGPRETSPTLIPKKRWDSAFVLAPTKRDDIELVLQCCMDLGVTGVVALELSSGYCLGMRGVELNADVAWAHIHCLNAVQRHSKVEDSLVTTEREYHVARALPRYQGVFLYATVDVQSGNIALARRKLFDAVESCAVQATV